MNEIKASIGNAGGTVFGVDRKTRLAPEIAAGRGWTCHAVGRFLIVRDSSTARRRIATHHDLFVAAFPASGRDSLALDSITDGDADQRHHLRSRFPSCGHNRSVGGRRCSARAWQQHEPRLA